MAAAAEDEAPKPAALPSYTEMILEAVAALGEAGGSSKAAVSQHIEEAYGDQLPEDHPAQLAAHLARMEASGELVKLKNNYMKPGPDTPPKRGRGRPPKPKTPLPPGEAPAPPRPRGRPPKPKDPLAAAVAKAAGGLPKRRGRPPKNPDAAPAAPAAPAPAIAGVKRGRGRPPKVKPQTAEVGSA